MINYPLILLIYRNWDDAIQIKYLFRALNKTSNLLKQFLVTINCQTAIATISHYAFPFCAFTINNMQFHVQPDNHTKFTGFGKSKRVEIL